MLAIKYFLSSSVDVIAVLLLLLCHNLAKQKMVCCGAFFPLNFSWCLFGDLRVSSIYANTTRW